MKKRILIVALVLGITPFARGCGISSGFPLAAGDFDPKYLHIFVINLLVMGGISWFAVRKFPGAPCLRDAYNALLAALSINWTAYLIVNGFPDTDPPALLGCAYNLAYHVSSWVPVTLTRLLLPAGTGNDDIFYDIATRIWFVTEAAVFAIVSRTMRRRKIKEAS